MDNLPNEMTMTWLWQLFKYEGSLVDVLIPKKIRRNSDKKFGFVRYTNRDNATKAIQRMNGQQIRDSNISVEIAKYGRKGQNT